MPELRSGIFCAVMYWASRRRIHLAGRRNSGMFSLARMPTTMSASFSAATSSDMDSAG
ncbi:MAG: hypothetical protein BWY83_01858 [bacterium ADurb.Bin478]|nr:MAG: hypothetical protein BWY83_01858 [bacterium ADurb.Bin478]